MFVEYRPTEYAAKTRNNLHFHVSVEKNNFVSTPDRRQSKILLTIDERGSEIATNSVFDCNLSPVAMSPMANENSVSNYFCLFSMIILAFSIAAYPVSFRCMLHYVTVDVSTYN